ncbi:MAG: hypothetical protein M3R25_14970, partial [Bacteroidota bacterium]|nr:hypothetical protein [Bacteroidota bacterium]
IVENTDGPQVSLGPDVLACNGEIITLIADISGVEYLWQDGSTSPDFSTDVSGTFILYVSNACGSDADTVMVDINGHVPVPDLGVDTVLCEGYSLELISLADASTSIAWQDGSSLPVLMVSDPGIYILSESNHCGEASDTLMVTYETAPELFDLGPDTILCPGQSIILMTPSTSALITWQDGNHANYITADQEQTYSLELSNLCGSVEDFMSVSFDERIPIVDIKSILPWCEEDIIQLDATQSFDAVYVWNNGSKLPVIEVNAPGLYAVSVTTDCQFVKHEIEVVQSDDCSDNI